MLFSIIYFYYIRTVSKENENLSFLHHHSFYTYFVIVIYIFRIYIYIGNKFISSIIFYKDSYKQNNKKTMESPHSFFVK